MVVSRSKKITSFAASTLVSEAG
ncbi:hypothetical protein LINPERPRIM_LOCUS30345 [Linum perenne]